MPFWSSASRGVLIEGQEQQRKSETLSTVTNTVDVDYFNTMHIPLLQGRAFAAADQEGSLPSSSSTKIWRVDTGRRAMRSEIISAFLATPSNARSSA